MSTNQIQRGENLTLTLPNISSNEPVQIGLIRGIALHDTDAAGIVDIATVGVFALPKVAAESFAVGDPVFLDGAGLATTADSGAGVFGVAVEAADVNSPSIAVRIAAF